MDVLNVAAGWLAEGEEAVALATVVACWGSSPRQPGSRMAVARDGRIAGSVSGGCVENDVVAAAEETLRTGRPQLLAYGVSDARAWEVGLPCGGKMQVFVERLGRAA